MSLTATLALLSLTAAAPADTACIVQRPQQMPAQGRPSPLDSLTFKVGTASVKVCYGRPSLRGRELLGSAQIPYGKLWRTGANEPTIFYAPVALQMAGIRVPPGLYSLYTVPGEKEWEIIVNRSTSQWGHESRYTDEVKAQELGRGKVPAESIAKPVETFTIRAEPGSGGAQSLVLEWETTRVKIPVKAG
jgi:Protein of unknown function (DUF2911)